VESQKNPPTSRDDSLEVMRWQWLCKQRGNAPTSPPDSLGVGRVGGCRRRERITLQRGLLTRWRLKNTLGGGNYLKKKNSNEKKKTYDVFDLSCLREIYALVGQILAKGDETGISRGIVDHTQCQNLPTEYIVVVRQVVPGRKFRC
jgi:hypothetical protein